MKKIKNPEKYIKRLKNRVEQLEFQSEIKERIIKRLTGSPLIFWHENTIDTQNVSGDELGDFRLNDEVVILGNIIAVEESFDDDGKPRSSITYRRKRTIRRVKRQ